MRQLERQIAVIAHQEQALGVLVETSNRNETLRRGTDEFRGRLAAKGIAHGGKDADGLVKDDRTLTLAERQRLPVNADLNLLRIESFARTVHDESVDRDVTGLDEVGGLPTGRVASVCDDVLKSFFCHCGIL